MSADEKHIWKWIGLGALGLIGLAVLSYMLVRLFIGKNDADTYAEFLVQFCGGIFEILFECLGSMH